mmetsp:Transcript_54777/g.108761  ORF Transcript_54777/g.108761 Transcript_54777/m.108761 type:complete len:304 (-) Transcript_54777:1298-2209(-)
MSMVAHGGEALAAEWAAPGRFCLRYRSRPDPGLACVSVCACPWMRDAHKPAATLAHKRGPSQHELAARPRIDRRMRRRRSSHAELHAERRQALAPTSQYMGQDSAPKSQPGLSAEESLDTVVDVEVAYVGVGLANADEDDGLACRVHKREGRAHLVVDGVKFSEHDAVDKPRHPRGRELAEGLIEARHLINCLVPDECLADKEHEVGVVDRYQLGKRTHKRFVVLHATGRVDQYNVVAHLLGELDAVGGDGRCVTAVAFLEDWELQRLCVHPKLLDGARAERIARAEHRGEAVRLEIVGHLRE